MKIVYDNKYTSIIDIYFYETFPTRTSSISILKTFLDTLSDILDKCLHFSLSKIEPVSIFLNQATLGPILSSVVYTFWLKMLPLVLIKNCNSCVCWIIILSNKLDLNQETRFTIIGSLKECHRGQGVELNCAHPFWLKFFLLTLYSQFMLF